MRYSLLIQSGDFQNFSKLFASLLEFEGGISCENIYVSATFPAPLEELAENWVAQAHPWNPAREWNRLMRMASLAAPMILCTDDVALTEPDTFGRLADAARETKSCVHPSIVGNVLGKVMLSSPYRGSVKELLSIDKGTDVPLVVLAVPQNETTEFDEEYLGYGREDHDFYEQVLAMGRKVYVTREVYVAHDMPGMGTGRSFGRRLDGGPAHDREQVRMNEARFRRKWGYL